MEQKNLRHRLLNQYMYIKFHKKVNVFSNKPYVRQRHNCKQNADVAYYSLYDQNKIQNYNLSENIYFIGVSIDGLRTISCGTQTPIFLPWLP